MAAAAGEGSSDGVAMAFAHTEVRTATDYPMFAMEVPKPVLRKGKARA
jgi:hypothetical protein